MRRYLIWRSRFLNYINLYVSMQLIEITGIDSSLSLQIRDLKVYIEAQKTLIDMADSDSIRGGTLLPVPPMQSSSANTRKHKKSGRRKN